MREAKAKNTYHTKTERIRYLENGKWLKNHS